MSKENNVKLSPPWNVYYKKINALFERDPEVTVQFDEENYEIKVFVDGNERKYEAISVLLPTEKVFGNVTVKTNVVPSNMDVERTWTDLFTEAFDGNPIFSYGEHVTGPLGTFDYIVFEGIVAQYYSDNLFDINGMTSDLFQNIAEDVFETGDDAVCFCTDTPIL